jgi:hypothetical protein
VKLTAEETRSRSPRPILKFAIRYSDNQVQIERAGEALVPADKLRDIVRESVDDTLSIEVANDNATIKGQDSKFTIYTQNPRSSRPFRFSGRRRLRESPAGTSSSLSAKRSSPRRRSRRATRSTACSSSPREDDQPRQHRWPAPRASQGRHQHLRQAPKDGVKAIVPAKALQLIDKLIDDPEAAVSFQIRENQVIFHTADATLTSNLVEASSAVRRRHSEGHRQGR